MAMIISQKNRAQFIELKKKPIYLDLEIYVIVQNGWRED